MNQKHQVNVAAEAFGISPESSLLVLIVTLKNNERVMV